MIKDPGEDYRADEDMIAGRHRYRRYSILAWAMGKARDHRFTCSAIMAAKRRSLTPEVDDGRLLATASVREVPVAGDEANQKSEVGMAIGAELTLAGLNQQRVADPQFAQLDLSPCV